MLRQPLCFLDRSSDTNFRCVVDNWRSFLDFFFFLICKSLTLYYIMIEFWHGKLWDDREALLFLVWIVLS